MNNGQLPADFFQRLAEVRGLCPEMRLGQFLSTLGSLAEDECGHSLWEVEDDELATALERFRNDLSRRAEVETPAPR